MKYNWHGCAKSIKKRLKRRDRSGSRRPSSHHTLPAKQCEIWQDLTRQNKGAGWLQKLNAGWRDWQNYAGLKMLKLSGGLEVPWKMHHRSESCPRKTSERCSCGTLRKHQQLAHFRLLQRGQTWMLGHVHGDATVDVQNQICPLASSDLFLSWY